MRSVRFLNREEAYDDAVKKFPEFKEFAGQDAFPSSFIVKLDDPEQHRSSTRRSPASPACSRS